MWGRRRVNEIIHKWVDKISDELVDIRRYLHQHPELSYQEFNTSDLVKNKLTEYGIPFRSEIAKTGVLGIIEGDHAGGIVALRADMDALPIDEKNEHSFVSNQDNVMHACGHDAHTSMLLGAGYILKQMTSEIHGTVLLVFQPAEEISPVGGAKPMLDDGIFQDYPPDVIYGQHVWPQLSAGQIGIRDKEMMGASDKFKISIKGKGGHASMPHLSSDPIVTAGYLITSLQTIVSRTLDTLEAYVITIGKIRGSHAANIISDSVQLEGSVRTYDPLIKKRLKERFFDITHHVTHMFNNQVDIDYLDGYPATINKPKWARLARHSAQTLFGDESTTVV